MRQRKGGAGGDDDGGEGGGVERDASSGRGEGRWKGHKMNANPGGGDDGSLLKSILFAMFAIVSVFAAVFALVYYLNQQDDGGGGGGGGGDPFYDY
jgi:hypothetical protein